MTASVTPKVKGSALHAQSDLAAIAINHCGQFAATPTVSCIVGYYLHEAGINTAAFKSQGEC